MPVANSLRLVLIGAGLDKHVRPRSGGAGNRLLLFHGPGGRAINAGCHIIVI